MYYFSSFFHKQMMITNFGIAFARKKIKINITRRDNSCCWSILLVLCIICIIHSYYDHHVVIILLQSNAFNCCRLQQHRTIVVTRESVLRIIEKSNFKKIYHNDHHVWYKKTQQQRPLSFRINKMYGNIIAFQQLTDTSYDNDNNNDNIIFPNNIVEQQQQQQQQSIVVLSDRKDTKIIRNNNKQENSNEKLAMMNDENKMIESFIMQVVQLIQNETFVSMTLYGPTNNNKNNKKKNSNNNNDKSNRLRGCIRLVTARLIKLKNNSRNINDDSSIIKLQVTFKYHSATDIVKNWDIPKQDVLTNDFEMIINNIDIAKGLHYLLTVNTATTESSYYSDAFYHRLIPLSEWDKQQKPNNKNDDSIIMNQIESIVSTKKMGIKKAALEHTNGNILELDIGIMNRIRWKIIKKTNTIDRDNNNEISNNDRENDVNNVILNHDRIKQFLVPITEPFWGEIGIVNKVNGKVIVGMSSKLKQCQKFVEIVNRLLLQSTTENQQQQNNNPSSSDDNTTVIQVQQNQMNNNNGKKRILSVVDMGCGRGYITFALHSFLQKHYSTTTFQEIQSIGYDIRPKLMNEMNNIIQSKLDHQFNTSLSFEVGTIESFIKEQQQKQQQQETEAYVTEKIHNVNNVTPKITSKDSSFTNNKDDIEEMKILIALHACDTATDDAIWCGIVQRAQIIVVAPCCHKQCRTQLNDYMNKHSNRNHPYYDILRHNVYRERISETVTDTIRALLLELAGYTVQVFEFIGGEHTSKNVMITGVRYNTTSKQQQQQQQQQDGQSKRLLINRIRSVAALHGIRYQKLAQSMNISLIQHDDESYNSNDFMSIPEQNSNLRSASKTRQSIQLMPPLTIKDNFF